MSINFTHHFSNGRRRECYDPKHSLREYIHRRVVKCIRSQQSANRCTRLSASSRVHRDRRGSPRMGVSINFTHHFSNGRRRESQKPKHSLRKYIHRRVVKCIRSQQSANRCPRLSASSRVDRDRRAIACPSSRVDRDAHDVVPRERVDRVTSCRDLFQRHRAISRDTASCRRGLTHHARTTRVTFK